MFETIKIVLNVVQIVLSAVLVVLLYRKIKEDN